MATEQKARFTPVGSGFDLPELEHGVLDLWDREKSFDALRRKNAGHTTGETASPANNNSTGARLVKR